MAKDMAGQKAWQSRGQDGGRAEGDVGGMTKTDGNVGKSGWMEREALRGQFFSCNDHKRNVKIYNS